MISIKTTPPKILSELDHAELILKLIVTLCNRWDYHPTHLRRVLGCFRRTKYGTVPLPQDFHATIVQMLTEVKAMQQYMEDEGYEPSPTPRPYSL